MSPRIFLFLAPVQCFFFFLPVAVCGSVPIDGADVTVTGISHSPLHCGWLQVECFTAIVLEIALSGAQRALTTVTPCCCTSVGRKKNKKLVKLRVKLWREKSGPIGESVSACVSFSFGQVTALPFVLVCVCPVFYQIAYRAGLAHINTNVSLTMGLMIYLFIFILRSNCVTLAIHPP